MARGKKPDGHSGRSGGESVGGRLGEEVVGRVLGAEECESAEGCGLMEGSGEDGESEVGKEEGEEEEAFWGWEGGVMVDGREEEFCEGLGGNDMQ